MSGNPEINAIAPMEGEALEAQREDKREKGYQLVFKNNAAHWREF